MFQIALLLERTHQAAKVRLEENERIFTQGDLGDSLFYIESGVVKLTVTSSKGKEALIGFLSEGELFGETSLLPNQPRRFHTATAVTESSVVRIERNTALSRLRSDWKVAAELLTWSLRRNHAIQQELVDQFLNSSEDRLVRVLTSLALVGKTTKTVPKVSQQDLANMIGLSRQHVNVLLARLKKSGVVGQDGRLKAGRTNAN